MFQIQGSLLAKSFAVMLLAVSYLVPSWQPATRTCTGPNCPRQQCTRAATIMIQSPTVTSVPQFFDAGGDQWVLVREPVTDEEPEDLVSPLAEEQDAAATDDAHQVKAEVEDDAEATTTEESPKTEGPTKKDQSAKAASTRDRATAKTQAAARTRAVWMRASDARAAGLAPVSTASSGDGFGSLGSAGYAARVPPAATYRVTQSYGSVGSGYSAFYGDPVTADCGACVAGAYYQSASPVYRTRRVWFPNLFPRLRGLR